MSFSRRRHRDPQRESQLRPQLLLMSHRTLAALVALALVAGCGVESDPLAEIRALHADGRFAESLELLEGLVDERPDDAEVLYLYGAARLRTRRPDLAIWPLQKAARDPDWMVPANLLLARCAIESRNPEVGIAAATRVLEKESDNRQALALRAQARLDTRRDLEEALADAEKVRELDPDDLGALLPRAGLLIMLERLDEAEMALEDLEGLVRKEGAGSPAESAYFCVTRATFEKEKGNQEAAEERFRACLEEYPTTPVVLEAGVEFYDEVGPFERTVEILRAALEQEPANPEFRRALAGRLRLMGKAEEAEALLLEGTQLEPVATAMASWASLSDHYVALGEYAAAVSAADRVLELMEEPNEGLLFAYAEKLVMAGRYERALDVAARIELEVYRDLVRGRVLLAKGKPREALERFEAALLAWPNHAVARYMAALAAEAAGDFDRAISEYRDSIRAGAKETDAGLRLARLHRAEGAFGPALIAVNHHLRDHPRDADALVLVIRVAQRVGNENAARDAATQLSRLPGGAGRAVAEAAFIVRARSGPRAAAEFIQGTEGLDLIRPGGLDALRALVLCLCAAGSSQEALSHADAALSAHPDFAAFHEIRGLALECSGAPGDETLAAYERALELDPDHPRALLALGRLAAEGGRLEEAVAFYDRAAATDPDDQEARRAAALLLTSEDRPEAAEQRLVRLLETHPYDAEAAIALAGLLLERQAQPERALELAQRAVRFGGGDAAQDVLDRAEAARANARAQHEDT